MQLKHHGAAIPISFDFPMEHPSWRDYDGSKNTKQTELMIVRQALLDATHEYTTKYLSSSDVVSSTKPKSSNNTNDAKSNSEGFEEEEEEEEVCFFSKRAKAFRKDGEPTQHGNTTAAEIQFCHTITQDMVKAIEQKDAIAMQNYHLTIENERLEKRRDEIQSELFLLRMEIQQLKGDCKALLQTKGSNQEWEVIEAANATILNLESLLSSSNIAGKRKRR